jgi:hypothetical protein
MIELGIRGGAHPKMMQSAQLCPEEQRSLTREFDLPLNEAECDSFGSGNAASAICHRSVTYAEAVVRNTAASIMSWLHCPEGVDGQD